jgi:hypothetical protein
MTNGFEIFDPATAFNPSAFAGDAGAHRLLEAAAHFPGGPVMLVFALFWSPVGPGIPAGVVLARRLALKPAVTFALYALSDVLSAFIVGPFFALLRRHGPRVRPIRWLGRRVLQVGTVGMRVPEAKDVATGRAGLSPVLFRIATVSFGIDVYTGGALASGLPVPRVAGWACAIAGDLVWFAMLLAVSMSAAQVVDNDLGLGLIVMLAMIVIPMLARRIFPSLDVSARRRPRASQRPRVP